MKQSFDNLFVFGRPASGKSEFLDFIKTISDAERHSSFHIGKYKILDDFVWLWEKCEEDDIWEKLGMKRLYSKRAEHAYVLGDAALFDFLIEKLNNAVCGQYLRRSDFYDEHTLLIEFSRGGERPYSGAVSRFHPDILKRAAIFYIEVCGAESQRRNEARFVEKLKSSVLAHKVPDEDMKRFYLDDDWAQFTLGRRDGFLDISGVKVPFVTMGNEPESKDPAVLAGRYGLALNRLWKLFSLFQS